jgi:phosphoribosylformylglycinamidine synthase
MFCSRLVLHRVEKSRCVWTKGLEGQILTFPSAHGYGKVVGEARPNVVLTYASESPNGGFIAGICSDNGRIFGLMDHPERPYGNPDGLEIFRNGIKAA